MHNDLILRKTDILYYMIIYIDEIISIEISSWLLLIDIQILRRSNKKLHSLFSYKKTDFNDTKVELVHIKKYRRLWNRYTPVNTAKNEYLDILKYFHAKTGPLNTDVAHSAAEYGHIDCAKAKICL